MPINDRHFLILLVVFAFAFIGVMTVGAVIGTMLGHVTYVLTHSGQTLS
jgi:hypothetical protein